jgi:hypothetical protein
MKWIELTINKSCEFLSGKIIFFFGPDGSGKTTLAKRTASALSKSGFKVRKGWMRGTHTLSYAFARLLRMHGAFRGPNHFMAAIPASLKPLWRFVEFVSVLPVILYRFTIPKALGFWVVAERYVPDYLVWVSIVLNDNRFVDSFEAAILLSMARKTGTSFYITADVCKLSERSGENITFLKSQQQIYARLALALGAKTIDTTNSSVIESFNQICSAIL